MSLANGWHQTDSNVIRATITLYISQRPPLNSQACSRCYNVILTTLLQALSPLGTSVELFCFCLKTKRGKKKKKKKISKLTFHLKHSHSCLVLSPTSPPPTPTTSNPHIPKEGTTASKQTHWPREGLKKTTALNKTIDTAWKGFIHITDYSSLTRETQYWY